MRHQTIGDHFPGMGSKTKKTKGERGFARLRVTSHKLRGGGNGPGKKGKTKINTSPQNGTCRLGEEKLSAKIEVKKAAPGPAEKGN